MNSVENVVERVGSEKIETFLKELRDKIEEKLNIELGNVAIETRVYPEWKELIINIGIKFYAFSETLLYTLENSCCMDNLEEEDFDEIYKAELEEINNKYVINVKGTLTFSGLTVEFYPAYMEYDDDIVGFTVEIHVDNLDNALLCGVADIAAALADIIAALYRTA